jgi:ABC-2 type transport system ATP-binding protein
VLDEVERVADHVVMLQRGRVVLNGLTKDVRRGHISAVLTFATPLMTAPVMAGVHAVTPHGSDWRVLFGGSRPDLEAASALIGARIVEQRTPTLDEILVARAGGKGS